MGAFAHEIVVLGVFVVSYTIWHRIGQHAQKMRAAKKLASWSTPVQVSSSVTSAKVQQFSEVRARTPDASSKATEAQILKHLDQREFTRALNLYRSVERAGRDCSFSEEFYSSFIQSAVRVGKIDVVERLLHTMKRNRLQPSLQFWQTTLKMLSSRKHYNTCLSIQALFARQIPTDKIVYSCFINAALEVGSHEKARDLLSLYAECGIDAKDHVLFFRTYVALKDVDAAVEIFKKLDGQGTTLMLNLLLLTCVNAGQPARALELLRETQTREKQDKVEKSIVDVISYNTVIKGLSKSGQLPDCFACLNEMSDRGILPDDITFGTLLDACIADKDMSAASEIVTLFADSGRPMDTVTCTLLIKGLVRAKCLPKALELYEGMHQRHGTKPDIITYSVLIKALVDQRDLDRALRLVEDMKVAGHRPDDIVLTHLLEGCRHAGRHELGQQLFQEAVTNGVKPSEYSLLTMLKLHGHCGAHVAAHELVAGWEARHGDKPSVIHYTCLVSGCLRSKNYDQAWVAYQLMTAHGVVPDGTAMSILLPGMVAAQQWDRVLTLATQALIAPQKYSVIPHEALNSALSQMSATGSYVVQASKLKMLMQNAGIPLTSRGQRRF